MTGFVDSEAIADGSSSRRQRRGRETGIVLLLAVAAGLVFLDRIGIAFVFPAIRDELGLSNAQLGMSMAVTSIAWAFSTIIFCFLSDVLGGRAKLFVVLSLVAFSVATALIGLAYSFAALLAIRALIGALEGPAIPLMQSIVARISSPHRVGLNLGIVTGGLGLLGGALPPVLMVGLAASFGWRGAFFVLAVPGFLLAVLVAWLVERDPISAASRSTASVKAGFVEALSWLATRNIALALVGAAALIGFFITFTGFTPLYLHDQPGMSASARTSALTLIGLAGALGTVVAPALSDRIGRKPCFIGAAFCTALVPVFVIMLANRPWLVAAAAAAQFVAAGGLTIIVYVIPSQTVPPRVTATVFALLVAIGEIVGGAGGPTLAGRLADHYGLVAAMWFCSALGFVALIVGFLIREPARAPRRVPRPDDLDGQ